MYVVTRQAADTPRLTALEKKTDEPRGRRGTRTARTHKFFTEAREQSGYEASPKGSEKATHAQQARRCATVSLHPSSGV